MKPSVGRRFCVSLFMVMALLGSAVAQNSLPNFCAKIEKTTYRGWDAYKLSNGIVSLYVTPQIGGRIIQMQLGDQEHFFVNKDLEGCATNRAKTWLFPKPASGTVSVSYPITFSPSP